MKYCILQAKLSCNNHDTWITYLPYKEFIKGEKVKGFNSLSVKSNKINRNIINEIGEEFFCVPIDIIFISDKQIPSIKYITKIKLGDKEIIS